MGEKKEMENYKKRVTIIIVPNDCNRHFIARTMILRSWHCIKIFLAGGIDPCHPCVTMASGVAFVACSKQGHGLLGLPRRREIVH
jgi:hypothetical protein